MDDIKEETTNKVLETKIDGLAKLTDTQLGHVNETLKDLKTLVSGFALKTELEEVKKDFNAAIKRIEDGFARHNEDDKESFGGLAKGQDDLRSIILKWIGALTIIAIALPFIAPLVFHFWFKIG